jgi:putative membrane protein
MKKILIVIMAIAIGMFVGCSKQRGNEMANGAGSPGNANNSTAAAPADTANGSAANGNASANLSSDDKDFITKAAQGGQEEVALGQLAQQNGSSDAVKSFGERMANDHQQANDKLKQIAQEKGVTLDENMPSDAQKDRDSLSKKKGADFDKAYMAMMVKDHEKDVKDFQKEADKGQDPDVKAFASQTLPTLQDHLNLAKQTKSGKSNSGSQSQKR